MSSKVLVFFFQIAHIISEIVIRIRSFKLNCRRPSLPNFWGGKDSAPHMRSYCADISFYLIFPVCIILIKFDKALTCKKEQKCPNLGRRFKIFFICAITSSLNGNEWSSRNWNQRYLRLCWHVVYIILSHEGLSVT